MRHSPYGKGYLISSSGPRPAPFTWHNTQQFNYDSADSEQLRFHFLPGRKHHLNYQVTWTTPSREDECFSHSRSFQVVECPQRATPKDMFTNNPRWQGRPPPCLGQVSGESEPLGRRGRPCLENIYTAAQAELRDKPHGSSALRPGAQRWADTTTGRGQVSAHWTGHRDDAQCVRGWENEREDSSGRASPSHHSQQLQGPAQPIPAVGFCCQVATQPSPPTPGRKRASELRAEQNMARAKGGRRLLQAWVESFKTDSSDRCTTAKTRQKASHKAPETWGNQDTRESAKTWGEKVHPNGALWYTGFYWNLINLNSKS